ncbi:unnamed protein product [Paramecium sonneborni]|uniref:Uncharacterized protein n=1 Tax=Paramecium sonneborni TaxID=65129 RepID=A0A8S1RR49_9CILI|nr:unnamed protein product [Paramecium sonneborni]
MQQSLKVAQNNKSNIKERLNQIFELNPSPQENMRKLFRFYLRFQCWICLKRPLFMNYLNNLQVLLCKSHHNQLVMSNIHLNVIYGRQELQLINQYMESNLGLIEIINLIQRIFIVIPLDFLLKKQRSNFIRQCLEIDERQRLNWSELFEHSCFHSRALKYNRKSNNKTIQIRIYKLKANLIIIHWSIYILQQKLEKEEQFKLFDINQEGTLNQNFLDLYKEKILHQVIQNYLRQRNQIRIKLKLIQILFSNDEEPEIGEKFILY